MPFLLSEKDIILPLSAAFFNTAIEQASVSFCGIRWAQEAALKPP
jgi:hypothetical protein